MVLAWALAWEPECLLGLWARQHDLLMLPELPALVPLAKLQMSLPVLHRSQHLRLHVVVCCLHPRAALVWPLSLPCQHSPSDPTPRSPLLLQPV